jgi:dephospho-CoA kinase
MSFLVGLTGGIGSGKSTVAKLFAEQGVPVIDADLISHLLTRKGGAAIPEIQREFGKEYIDETGALDRARMRQLVFSAPACKERLEKILHPLILKQTKLLATSNAAPYVIVVVPLLFETSEYTNWLNSTLTVDCSENTQISRATLRDSLDEDTVRAIMSKQLSRTQRQQMSNNIILNEGTMADLRTQIKELHSRYLAMAQGSN